ncbi:MAG: hypothetical protein ACXWLR_01135 [Myxococcales bacterium]
MKLVVLLFALMLAIGLAALWLWRRAPPVEPCATRAIAQSRSPDDRALADVFEVICGTSVTTHVALRPSGAPEQARADVFVALGVVPVRALWTGSAELAVESPAARVVVSETRWRNVAVRIRRSP